MIPTIKEIAGADPKMSPTEVLVVHTRLVAREPPREDLEGRADHLAQIVAASPGIHPGFQLELAELNVLRASLGNQPAKICGARRHDPESPIINPVPARTARRS